MKEIKNARVTLDEEELALMDKKGHWITQKQLDEYYRIIDNDKLKCPICEALDKEKAEQYNEK